VQKRDSTIGRLAWIALSSLICLSLHAFAGRTGDPRSADPGPMLYCLSFPSTEYL